MGIEIERKYLVKLDLWAKVKKGKGSDCTQAYLTKDPKKIIRVRVIDAKSYITIKGKTIGLSRPEYEYEIPKLEGQELIDSFGENKIIKIRHNIDYKGHLWEVDVFKGDNLGLIVAEIELKSEEEAFEMPEWIGKEVSFDKRYINVCLGENPYKNWKNKT